ncbi:MAG TPA: hypothetical protein VKB90_12395 [Candidatus Acidoferrum sp.]|nr:hypothetical protein [Candidatus Acidoferrum sp.]
MATASERSSDSGQWWSAVKRVPVLLTPMILVELFATLNVGFLTFDIYLAHSVNQFRNRAESIPLFFSAIAPLLLIFALGARYRSPAAWKYLGYFIGWIAVLVGLTGVIFHLQSHFFYEHTLRSLTYSAPFAAPLAYTGLGFLIILNRMVDAGTLEWAQWVLLLALGGFVGNFIFSVADHAQNGFFRPLEWVPVVASAIAVGFLAVPLLMRVSRRYIHFCGAMLLLEGAVGVWGFAVHAAANFRGPSIHAFDNFIYGAPPLAPLLFPNLMLLGLIALRQLASRSA